MPNRGDNTENPVLLTRKLHPSGNSTVLVIPPEILDAAELGAGDVVSFEVAGDDEVILREAAVGESEQEAPADD